MLFKRISKKLLVATIALIVIALVYFFPNGSDPEVYEQNIEYIEANKNPIYLKDNNNYIARTDIIMKETETEEKVKEIIESLTINSSKKDYIPNGFSALIPQGTKVLSLDFDGTLLKINFDSNFKSVSLEDEEAVIEAIVYSLTEINSIKKIMIFVDGELLTRLPNSNKKLPHYLTRDYGINKIYDLNTLADCTITTIYYLSKFNEQYYYVPVTTFSNNPNNKIEIVINNLKGNSIYNPNLLSYMVNSVELLSYELEEEKASLNFNSYIFDNFDDKTISEEVKYTILLSLKDSMGIEEVVLKVNDEEIDKLSIES